MKNYWMRWLTPAVAVLALVFVAQAKAEGQTVKGTVNGTDGKPASGVQVRLIKASDMPADGAGGRRRPGAGDTGGTKPDTGAAKPEQKAADGDKPAAKPGGDNGTPRARPTPVGQATTDDKGAFEIKDIPAGDYVLMAGARGTGTGREKVTVVAGSDPAPVTITLKQGQRRGAGAGAGEAPKPAETK